MTLVSRFAVTNTTCKLQIASFDKKKEHVDNIRTIRRLHNAPTLEMTLKSKMSSD